MVTNHRLTGSELDALAAGLGDRTVVRRLRAAQVSKRMVQLRTLHQALFAHQFGEHHELLAEAARQSPDTVTAVLEAPHTGAWLASTLREVRGAWQVPHRPVEVHLHYLGALAAATAIRAGLDFKTEVVATDGGVVLPGLGRALVDDGTVTVTHCGGETRVGRVRVPARPADDGDNWQGQRRITAGSDGLTISVCLDDLDPYRDCHRLSPAGRLDRAQVSAWQRLLADAWALLVRHHRPYAEAIAEGLTAIVPLHRERANIGVNVTSMDSFGAVSLTEPTDGLALALGLLHEFQHAKLGALIDIVQLYERDDQPRYYAPWRDDPRPLGAALQGVYAFLGVTDFWRVQRHVLVGGPARAAEAEFVRWRDRVRRTFDELAASDRFTPAGRRLLDGLREVQDRWRDEAVSTQALASAQEAAEDHWTGWRLRNRHPAPEAVRRLAARWRQGLPCPAEPVPTTTQPGAGRLLARSARLDLARLRLTEPARFAELCAAPESVAQVLPEASEGDVALAQGRYAAAQQCYRAEIMAGTDSLDPWIGLVLASHRDASRGGPPLLAAPELCLAVCRELAASGDPAVDPVDPLALARWLRPADAHVEQPVSV